MASHLRLRARTNAHVRSNSDTRAHFTIPLSSWPAPCPSPKCAQLPPCPRIGCLARRSIPRRSRCALRLLVRRGALAPSLWRVCCGVCMLADGRASLACKSTRTEASVYRPSRAPSLPHTPRAFERATVRSCNPLPSMPHRPLSCPSPYSRRVNNLRRYVMIVAT